MDATGPSGKKAKDCIAPTGQIIPPSLPWADNQNQKIWELIGEMEEDENYAILFGKKQKTDVCI